MIVVHNAHAYRFFTVIAFIHPINNGEMKGDRVPPSRQSKRKRMVRRDIRELPLSPFQLNN